MSDKRGVVLPVIDGFEVVGTARVWMENGRLMLDTSLETKPLTVGQTTNEFTYTGYAPKP